MPPDPYPRGSPARAQSPAASRGSGLGLSAADVLEALPVACVVVDGAGGFRYVNRAFVATFGYAPDDLPTLEHWWPLAYPHPAARESARQRWHDRLEAARTRGISRQEAETVVTCRDGSSRQIAVDVTLLDPDAGLHLVLLHDTTTTRRHGHDLAHVIAERARRHSEALHEDLGQRLAGLSMLLASVAHRAATLLPGALDADLEQLVSLSRECVTATRELARDVAPVALRRGRLPDAIADLADTVRSCGIRTDVRVEGTGFEELRPVVAEAAYRIVEEALTNARTHARAGTVTVALTLSPDRLLVQVDDDGAGFRPDATVAGTGIGGMRQVARAVSGWVEIASGPGAGTRVRATMPLGLFAVPTGAPPGAE
jgi:PAS domain S-box-containing protein